MARPLRIEYEGALYHIVSRGNEEFSGGQGNKAFKNASETQNYRKSQSCGSLPVQLKRLVMLCYT